MTPKLLIETSSRRVTTITLNRPEAGNACDPETLGLLSSALSNASDDASVRVIVLRGAGKNFCSGFDVRAARSGGVDSGVTFPGVCRQLDRVLKPVVAVVQGGCIGAGIAMAACCDIVLASEDAFFSFPEVRLGMTPGPLALYSMRGMGARGMRRYLLTGERFGARVAEAHGLVHAVHPASELNAAFAGIVDALLLGAPGALMRAKAMIAEHGAPAMTEATFSAMQAAFERNATDAEAQEGRASFREKRKPNWYPAKE